MTVPGALESSDRSQYRYWQPNEPRWGHVISESTLLTVPLPFRARGG